MTSSTESTAKDGKKKATKETPVSPRLKFWVDLAKWFIVSVALVVVADIIDAGFRKRTADLAEMKFYNEYVTSLVVLNPSPVNRLLLAEYFICVSPTEQWRSRWQTYYDSVYPDYIAYTSPIREENERLLEQLGRLDLSDEVAGKRQQEAMWIRQKMEANNRLLYPLFAVPVPPAGVPLVRE